MKRLHSLWALALGLFLGISSVNAATGVPVARYDFGKDPMRYLENSRLRLGVDLSLGGAVTLLEDKKNGNVNMINSHDWGRQIQMSYYSGPIPYIGPKKEEPHKAWAQLGWNPIQSGSVGRIKSRTLAFEKPDAKTIRVRCVPMQWPHINVEGDCIFEVTYTLVSENTIQMKARIINQRQDKTQYPGRHQEMPALYTNGPWYKLVTYTGDSPFTDAPTTNIVDKADGKGWPWSYFEATEQWSALVNDSNIGVGLYQSEVIPVTGGFAGGDNKKGVGGCKDMQTGYIAPIGTLILDYNIDWTYQTYLIVGSVNEIRRTAKALHGPPVAPSWRFENDRKGFTYRGSANDSGWPIKDALQITYREEARGVVASPTTVWQAERMPTLNLDAAFTFSTTNKTANVVIEVVTFSGKRIAYPLKVLSDGTRQNYSIPLAVNAQYTGAMKQILLYLPKANGTLRFYKLQGSSDKKLEFKK
jgi:hypothetical protein